MTVDGCQMVYSFSIARQTKRVHLQPFTSFTGHGMDVPAIAGK